MKDNSGHSEGGEVPKLTKEQPTNKAIKDCADWLNFCLSIGWPKHELDGLEKIWWEHHDEKGNLTAWSVAAPKPDEWYTENEMYQWLITQKYSEEIAKELSTKWAVDLQWSFNKGFKKGSDFITKSELAAAKESIAIFKQILLDYKSSGVTVNIDYLISKL